MANFKDQMARIGIKARMFNDLLKAAQQVQPNGSTPEEGCPKFSAMMCYCSRPRWGFTAMWRC